MQKTNKFIAISALSIGLLFNIGAHAQSNPAAAALGGVKISNGISGSVSIQNGGSSESHAVNSQTAQASIGVLTATASNAAAAGFSGQTLTQGAGTAWNYSTGTGQGGANSYGSSAAAVAGGANIANIGLGGNLAAAGAAGAGTGDSINAGTNQGAVTATQSSSSLQVSLGASTGGAITSALNDNSNPVNQVTLTDTKTGDASVSGAAGGITLGTGVNSNGQPTSVTLGQANTNTSGSGSFSATASGQAAVATVGGTIAGLTQAVAPVTNQVIGSGAVQVLSNSL
jgi:hypothetical protein